MYYGLSRHAQGYHTTGDRIMKPADEAVLKDISRKLLGTMRGAARLAESEKDWELAARIKEDIVRMRQDDLTSGKCNLILKLLEGLIEDGVLKEKKR